MENKFTAGPWKVERGMDQMIFNDTTVCELDYGKGIKVFVSSPSELHGDEEATAKLIAAAPDMLAALQEFVKWAEFENKFDKCGQSYYLATAAINKALNK